MNRNFSGIFLFTLTLLFIIGGQFAHNPSLIFADSPTVTATVTPTVEITPSASPAPGSTYDCTKNNPSIGGVISGTVGSKNWFNDVFCVTEDLIIPAGETLTINWGTTLVFLPERKMTVAGQLIARGSRGNIRFMSPFGAGWEGIHFLPSAQPSECRGCSLENLGANNTALTVEAPLTFKHGLIEGVAYGVAISTSVPITLSNVVINYVGTGLHLSGETNAVHKATHLTLSQCHSCVVNHGQTLSLDNSIVVNSGIGISTGLSGTTTVSYTLFHHNREDFRTEQSAQLNKGPGLLYESPGFVDSSQNFHLQADSPAVNRADPAADYTQEPGYNGGRADLGAYGNTRSAPEQPPEIELTDFRLSVNALQQIAQPGETVIYTLQITNLSSISDAFSVGAATNYQDEFFITSGLNRGRYDTYYSGGTRNVEPGGSDTMNITVEIPQYATQGMVHVIEPKVHTTEGTYVELQLTTIVSPNTTIERIGQLGLSPQDVYVQGDYAYLAAGRKGLHILDISKPDTPTAVGFYSAQNDPIWSVQKVIVQDNYAYLVAGQAGLWIIDVSDPANPVEVGFYNTLGSATGINLRGDYAYVTWQICSHPYCSNQLRIVDISNPNKPIEVGTYKTLNTITAVELVGEWAYLGVKGELEVLNISQPDKMRESTLFEHAYGYSPYDIVANGNYIYLAAGDTGLQVFDISNPTYPVEMGTFKVSDMKTAYKLTLVESHIYLVDSKQLHIIDISNPTVPISVSVTPLDMGRYPNPAIAITEGYAYLTTASTGLHTLDVSTLTSPKKVNVFGGPNLAQGIAVINDYAYVADGYLGLRIFDISNPTRPTEAGFYDKPGGAWAVSVKDNYAYVTFGTCESFSRRYGTSDCDTSLFVLDVSNPESPVEVEGYAAWKEIKIADDYAYVLDEERALHVLDISNPAAPRKINQLDMEVTDFDIINGYLYVLPPSGFKFIDSRYTHDSHLEIFDPMSLSKIAAYPLPHPAVKIVVVGNYAYIYWYLNLTTVHSDRWLAVDVSDPMAPLISEETYLPIQAETATVNGQYAYLADGKAGLRILDISDAANPTEVDAFGANHIAMDVAVSDGTIYLANGSGGLQILRYPESKPLISPPPTITPTALPIPFTSTRPASTPLPPTPPPCTQTAAEPFVDLYTDEDRATRLGCPINPGFTTLTPSQQFEEGFMLKIEDTIYVFWSDNSVVPYPDTWDESQTIDNPTLTPPDNLQQPTRRFGKIWHDHLGGPEAKIGWALEAEQEYEITYQHFSGGLMFIAPDGEVYTLFEE